MAGTSKKIGSFFKKKRVEESSNFVRNGGAVMENLIRLSNGRNEMQLRRFTVGEITDSTNNFEEEVMRSHDSTLFKGNLDGRPVSVQIWDVRWYFEDTVAFSIAISALVSHLKNMLKLIGYCPDFGLAALVYEYVGSKTLPDFLGEGVDFTLSWRNRIKIARDLAAMLVYLHTCFPRAIIHRGLNPFNVLIDQNGDVKLFDFSLAVEIPEGESEVEEPVAGTRGFLAPECFRTLLVTTKIDVYAFGVILLMLLTGKRQPFCPGRDGIPIREYVEEFMDGDVKLIDRNISQEVGVYEFDAIKDLALWCTEDIADHRPEMVDVARRLHEIAKQADKVSYQIVSPFEYNRIALKKKLMLLSSGRYAEIPFHIFSSEEIISGTNNFQEYLVGDTYYGVCKGYLDGRPVLVKKWQVLEESSHWSLRHAAVFEAAVLSCMSDLKHAPKLVGCCLEFEIPYLVFEDVRGTMTLYEVLYTTNHSQLLSWGHRLKIASDIAHAVSHLQTAFQTPIIHRDLKPSNVIISPNGEAKLVEFSMAIALPRNSSHVKDNFIVGTWGSLDPDCLISGFVSTKTDVYSFGVLLLVLLTGMNLFWVNSEGTVINVKTFVEEVISEGQIDCLVDPRMLQDVEMTQFEALLDIARRCTRIRGKDRPEMIDVARLLHQIGEDAIRVSSN